MQGTCRNIFCTVQSNIIKMEKEYFQGKKLYYKIVSIHLHQFYLHGLALHQANDTEEHIFSARNSETTHWMVIPKFFLTLTQQILK